MLLELDHLGPESVQLDRNPAFEIERIDPIEVGWDAVEAAQVCAIVSGSTKEWANWGAQKLDYQTLCGKRSGFDDHRPKRNEGLFPKP